MDRQDATDGTLTCAKCGSPRPVYKGCSNCGAVWPTHSVSRANSYMISINRVDEPTLLIRATEDQELRIRQMTDEQRARFCHIMGG